MKLEFDSIEEVKVFVAELKGKRGPKDKGDDDTPPHGAAAVNVPAPMQVPTTQFNPPNTSTSNSQPAWQVSQAAGPAPEVTATVGKIAAKLDATLAAGSPLEPALAWFRGELAKNGHDASAATMDQIKSHFLPKLTMPALEGIAKLMGVS
jgi:hypothetical protein